MTTTTRQSNALHPVIADFYANQTRYMVLRPDGRERFIVHDTAIGGYWFQTFATYDDAVRACYDKGLA